MAGSKFNFPCCFMKCVNHFLSVDVTANLQVFLPVLLCRRNRKDSFCHGNVVRCRGLCSTGGSVQTILFLPKQIS